MRVGKAGQGGSLGRYEWVSFSYQEVSCFRCRSPDQPQRLRPRSRRSQASRLTSTCPPCHQWRFNRLARVRRAHPRYGPPLLWARNSLMDTRDRLSSCRGIPRAAQLPPAEPGKERDLHGPRHGEDGPVRCPARSLSLIRHDSLRVLHYLTLEVLPLGPADHLTLAQPAIASFLIAFIVLGVRFTIDQGARRAASSGPSSRSAAFATARPGYKRALLLFAGHPPGVAHRGLPCHGLPRRTNRPSCPQG